MGPVGPAGVTGHAGPTGPTGAPGATGPAGIGIIYENATMTPPARYYLKVKAADGNLYYEHDGTETKLS
jgi:hypothetical protein